MDVAVPHVPHSVLHAPASACALPGLLGYRPLADITSGPMGLTSADPIAFTFSSQNGVSSGETSLLRSHAADRWHGRRLAAASLCCDKHPTTLCGGSMRTPTPLLPPALPTSGISWECKLGDAAGNITDASVQHDWRACTSPATYSALPDGSYQFAVRAQVRPPTACACPQRPCLHSECPSLAPVTATDAAASAVQPP